MSAALFLVLAAAAFALERASGDVISIAWEGPAATVTLLREDGKFERLKAGPRTRFVCEHKNLKRPSGPDARCPVSDMALYDPATRMLAHLEMVKRGKGKPRPAIAANGEIAGADVVAGTVSVRFENGPTLSFKTGDKARAEDLKVGDRVSVRSLDRSSLDELKVLPPAP